MVALANGEVVGYTGLRRTGAASPLAQNLLTAVRRPWRRQGIATALKREQIARAREAGIEEIRTTNDETNAGMRGVNARLGYVPAPGPDSRQRPARYVMSRRRVTATATAPSPAA